SKAAVETGVISWIYVWCIRTRFESTLPFHHVPYQTAGISAANVRYKSGHRFCCNNFRSSLEVLPTKSAPFWNARFALFAGFGSLLFAMTIAGGDALLV